MKVLSIAVPCYNSEGYMRKCIDSLIAGGEDVEVIIVNDGSCDKTGEIADEYAARYPAIVKAVHQENGGHGEAVNSGLRNATGLYYKVVDSDDWLDTEVLKKIIGILSDIIGGNQTLDMFISDFVYDKEDAARKKIMSYRMPLPQNQIFTWNEVRHFRKGQYILMHSVIYRTKLLRECGLQLPKHTFYVDNIFVFQPLPYVKTMYYLNEVFYHYFIGREDQSVNEAVMIKRIDQQLRVNKLLIDYMDLKKIPNKKILNYMLNYLDIIMTVSSIMLIRSGAEENLKKKKELWEYLKAHDKKIYYKLRLGLLGSSMNLPGKSGRTISVAEYKIARKIFGFN